MASGDVRLKGNSAGVSSRT